MRPAKSSLFKISDKYGIKLLTQLRVEFSDLRVHRLHHNFNCPSAVCACTNEDESTEHYLLRCPLFSGPRCAFFRSLENAVNDLTSNLDSDLWEILLYGGQTFREATNKLIIEVTIRFIKSSKRFKTLEAFMPETV
jgi:hypothetical protein